MPRRRSTESTVIRFAMIGGAAVAAPALLLALLGKVVFESEEIVRVALTVAAIAIAPTLLMLCYAVRRTFGPFAIEDDLHESDERQWEAIRRRRFASYRRRMRENPPRPANLSVPGAP